MYDTDPTEQNVQYYSINQLLQKHYIILGNHKIFLLLQYIKQHVEEF